jgi:hypothetical protein
MKVCITIAEQHDGTFKVLYCGNDPTQAMDACINHHEPDTKEVCMFRKPFHYKRVAGPVLAAPANRANSNAVMARHLFGAMHARPPVEPPLAEDSPAPETLSTAPAPEAVTLEQSAETFLGDAPAPATEPVKPRKRK